MWEIQPFLEQVKNKQENQGHRCQTDQRLQKITIFMSKIKSAKERHKKSTHDQDTTVETKPCLQQTKNSFTK